MTAQQQAYDFLARLYGDDAPGSLLLWTLSNKRSHWLPARDLREVAHLATELAYVDQVYFGCGLHAEALGLHGRGEAEHVRTLPGLWADLDFGTAGHRSTRNPPTLEDALWIVRTFPLSVSVVVHSGYGV